MANLPLSQPASQQDTRWKSILDPVIACPLINGQLLENLKIVAGNNTINHGLGRPLVGFIVIRNSGATSIGDNQAINATPALTLTLTSNGTSTVSLWVF